MTVKNEIRPAFIRKAALGPMLGVTHAQIDAFVRHGILPEGHLVGARARAWDIETVEDLIQRIRAGKIDWSPIKATAAARKAAAAKKLKQEVHA